MVDLDYFSVSDPQCTLETKESGLKNAVWRFNGKTEVIDNNLNPKWIKSYKVWFIFVKDIDLHFMIHNYNGEESQGELIGEGYISLSQLMLA